MRWLIAPLWVLAMPAAAAEAPKDVYFQLDGGVAYFSDNEFLGEEIVFDDGWTGGLRVGSKSGRLSVELELAAAGAAGANGDLQDIDLTSVTFGSNLFGDLVQTSWLDWYLGGGIALAYNHAERTVDFLGTPITVEDEAVNVALSAETGFVLKPTDFLHLVPHYRFTWLPGIADDAQFVHMGRLGLRLVP